MGDDTQLVLKDILSHLSMHAETTEEDHPYIVAGGLLLLCRYPELLLTPLRFTAKTAVYLVVLPVRLVALPFKLLLWILGFRRHGVEKDSFASRYQSRNYGGRIPPDSTFSQFQSFGATEDYYDDMCANFEEAKEGPVSKGVRWLAGIGAALVLTRQLGVA